MNIVGNIIHFRDYINADGAVVAGIVVGVSPNGERLLVTTDNHRSVQDISRRTVVNPY